MDFDTLFWQFQAIKYQNQAIKGTYLLDGQKLTTDAVNYYTFHQLEPAIHSNFFLPFIAV